MSDCLNDVAPRTAVRPLLTGIEPARDYFEALLTRLAAPTPTGKAPQVIGITSAGPRQGASTAAANLALVAADPRSQRVLLVDANLDQPAQHRRFGVKLAPGLSDAMRDGVEVTDVLQHVPAAGLTVLAAGKADDPARRWLGTPRVAELMDTLRLKFDCIVVDMPPTHALSPALRLARLTDAMVLVVEAERVRSEVARRAVELLAESEAFVAGVVLNKWRRQVPQWLSPTL